MPKDKPDLSKVYEVHFGSRALEKRWLGYWVANRNIKEGEAVTIEC